MLNKRFFGTDTQDQVWAREGAGAETLPEGLDLSRRAENRGNLGRAIPSIIHFFIMIRLLSTDISPNPETTDFVGKRWTIPHTAMSAETK